MEYHAFYKCRLCGAVYDSGGSSGKDVAQNATTGACLNIPLVMQQPSMLEPHSCENGSIGVADFIGFKKMDEKDE